MRVSGGSLDQLKDDLCSIVDQNAQLERDRHLTRGVPYELKVAEAVAFARHHQPGPHLREEAKALGIDPATLAGTILEKDARWRELSAKIDAARIVRKRAIRAAKTAAEARQAAVGAQP
jgi:hypothetical protein